MDPSITLPFARQEGETARAHIAELMRFSGGSSPTRAKRADKIMETSISLICLKLQELDDQYEDLKEEALSIQNSLKINVARADNAESRAATLDELVKRLNAQISTLKHQEAAHAAIAEILTERLSLNVASTVGDQRFCDRYNEATGANINEAILRRWASKDEVPPEAVEFAKSSKILRISEAEKVKSDQSWTMEELTQAEELFEKTKMTTNQIASQLGKRFGRRMDKHTVMNAKQRIFLRSRTLEIYDGGETNMRKILQTLKDEFPDGYGVTLMEVNRFVGLMRGRPDLLPAGGLVLQETQP